MFESGVLKRIFGPKRDKVTGEWRKLHNVELNDFLTKYYSGDQIENYVSRACSTFLGERRVLVGKPEGRRLFWRPGHEWEDNVKKDLIEVLGRVGVAWTEFVCLR